MPKLKIKDVSGLTLDWNVKIDDQCVIAHNRWTGLFYWICKIMGNKLTTRGYRMNILKISLFRMLHLEG